MAMRVSSARFIGREPELTELESALTGAREGRPSIAFVAGESGVGKTRLLREIELRAGEAGGIALGGECIELGGEEVPYAPLTAALRPLVHEENPVFGRLTESARCELARLAPELGDPPAPRGEDGREEAQRQLFDALLALLSALSEEQPVLLWLEDVHWADRSTRSFLVYLARSLRSERVLTVATYRSDELHRRHPMRPLLAELERLPGTRRIELARFDRDEVRIQLADIAGAEPDDAALDRLFARSEGNPLFSEELLAAGVDGRGAPPPTLRDALLLRSERLSPEAQQQLRLLAVAGRADEELLAELSADELPAVREALREAVAENLLTPVSDRRLGFRHALLREVVYDDLLPGERVDLHLQIARVLDAREDDSRSRRAAVAHHFHAAEAQPDALRTAIIAGADAERVSAYGEASSLFDRALALWPRVNGAAELSDVRPRRPDGPRRPLPLPDPRGLAGDRAPRAGGDRARRRGAAAAAGGGARRARLRPLESGLCRPRDRQPAGSARAGRRGAEPGARPRARPPGAPAPAAGALPRGRGGGGRGARDRRRDRRRLGSCERAQSARAWRSSSPAITSAASRSCGRGWRSRASTAPPTSSAPPTRTPPTPSTPPVAPTRRQSSCTRR